MLQALTAVRSYLDAQYASCASLSLNIAKSGEAISSEMPTLQWQNSMLRPVADPAEATGIVVLDADIGLCLFLQLFSTASDVRAQIARALSIRSDLMPHRITDSEEIDRQGEWSVALAWLCESEQFDSWLSQIAELRSETAFFEEVPVDAIVNTHNSWSATLETHGLPKLLLRTRAALKRTQFDEAANWISADPVIRARLTAALSALPQSVSSMAMSTLAELAKPDVSDTSQQRPLAEPDPLYNISIKDFRNISSLTIELRNKHETVASNVIQGPNGTGKSALAEAMSIAIGGVSSRYIEFLNDTNEANQDKTRKYIERYLTPLESTSNSLPMVGLNNRVVSNIKLADQELAHEKSAKLSGTLLSQSWAENLTRIRAEELGAQIAGDYSQLATRLIDYLDMNTNSAEGERTAFNREWGLRANVSRDDTAKQRISALVLEQVMSSSKDVRTRLSMAAQSEWRLRADVVHLLSRWQQWEDAAGERARAISRLSSDEQLNREIHAQLVTHNLLLQETSRLLGSVSAVARAVGEAATDVEAKSRLWATWLRRPLSEPVIDQLTLVSARTKLASAQQNLDKASQMGTSMRERLVRVESVATYVQQHWQTDHPNSCPVCESDVTERGGIANTLGVVLKDLQDTIQQKRQEYAEIKRSADAAAAELSKLDSVTPPLSIEEQSKIQTALRHIFSTEFSISNLADEAVEQEVVALLRFVLGAPIVSLMPRDETALIELASENSLKISAAFKKFTLVSEAPECWKMVRRTVISELAAAIEEHLPRTTQSLWWELARSMMPAPWQYPGPVAFTVDHKRSQTEARLVVRGRDRIALAAHILNSAELHNLGIAWFFTRYLTYGRYFYSSIVLDDPAGQMDQPSFRDFCRFLETLVRLHRRLQLPLTLALFLHQDDRALEAARTTDGTLHFLRWNRGSTSFVRRWKMRVAPMGTRKPFSIVQSH